MASSNFAAGAYAAVQGLSSGRPTRACPADDIPGRRLRRTPGPSPGRRRRCGPPGRHQAISAASGKANVVDVVTAVAESETALQTMVAVRDRMISAYEEIMRMQI